jgi:hypothetical protein
MLMAKSNNQIETTWNIKEQETAKLHLAEQIQSLLIHDEKVKDPEEIAGAFSTASLLTIAGNLNWHQEVRGDAISFFFFLRGLS